MKKYIIFLFAILIVSQAIGQKKKKGKTDPKDAQIDTLTKANQTFSKHVDSLTKLNKTITFQLDSVSNNLDSVSNNLKSYSGLYTVIKEKVLKHDFDPGKLPEIIDSLAASKDAILSGSNAAYNSLRDSVAALKKENSGMQTTLENVSVEDAEKTVLINELKQLKELLDAKILTQTEFNVRKSRVLQKWK
jgi:peptidoglycan hydrolase CwlO-like protein